MTKCQLQSGCLPDDPQKTMLIRGGDFSRDGYNLGIKELHLGTFLVIQWLRLHSQCRGPGLTPGQGTRPCMPQPRPSADKLKKKKKKKNSSIQILVWQLWFQLIHAISARGAPSGLLNHSRAWAMTEESWTDEGQWEPSHFRAAVATSYRSTDQVLPQRVSVWTFFLFQLSESVQPLTPKDSEGPQ